MKGLLIISLILNIGLGIALLQRNTEPEIERIVLEQKPEPQITHQPPVVRKAPEKAPLKIQPPPVIEDERSFERAGEDLVALQATYLEDLEINEQTLQKKEKLTKDFYAQTGAIYKKHPYGLGLNFNERRKVIELEEKLHQDYAKLFGPKKWSKYKTFVDEYNQKLIQNHKSRDFSPLMMGY